MRFLVLLAVVTVNSGCAIIIGRHPDTRYVRTYCYPCIEATQNVGVGIMWSPDNPGHRLAVGWSY